jgi:hypothetical protein
MLLAGPEFGGWLAGRQQSPVPAARVKGTVVRIVRTGGVLHITLDDPARRNPFSAAMRDQLCDALDVAVADASVRVVLDGAGNNFCSGGDLTEFGATPNPTVAHLIRTDRSVGRRLCDVADRTSFMCTAVASGRALSCPGSLPRWCAIPLPAFVCLRSQWG